MSRSHPPTLLKIIERTVSDELRLSAGDVVLVAVSGGPDSIALLHALAKLLPRRGVHLVAHGVDHGLREAARDELAVAAALAAELGVAFAVTTLAVAPGSNLMARARSARFAALREALAGIHPPESLRATGQRLIATGHHADDRAETALMRLLRGSGPSGLAVLPPRSRDLIRPLIRARRTDVMAHLARHRLACCEDPTNRDPRFLRARVRHEVLPTLLALSPHIVEHLCDLADALGQGAPMAHAAPLAATMESSTPPLVAVERKKQVTTRLAARHERGSAPAVPAEVAGITLGRAQRVALERAFRNGNSRARIPLRGGAIARVDLTSATIVLTKGK